MTDPNASPPSPPDSSPALPEAVASAGAQAPTPAPLRRWMAEGLRVSMLQAPRLDAVPTPWQLALLTLIPVLLWVGMERLTVAGAATFQGLPVLHSLWPLGLLLWLGWWTLSGSAADPKPSLSRWWVLVCWAVLPWHLLLTALSVAYARAWLPELLSRSPGFWLTYGGLQLMAVVAAVILMARCAPQRMRMGLYGAGLIAIIAFNFWTVQQDWDPVWRRASRADADESESARLQLSQETFEAQQALWQRTLAALAPRHAGRINVYGLVYAPYAEEDVFLRESALVSSVLESRFDAKGHVVQLVNNARTTQQFPWATPLNLQRTLQALAQRMKRKEDLLVVYMSSHGARDFKLASSHWPLTVAELTPQDLRQALDAAGIDRRVIAISACYSGGWIEPLANDNTLVMTAADAEHTSYGCGAGSELTFFGRALFDEQLRQTRSFEKAFAAVVPIIQAREIEAGKDDGFSNPQIRVGSGIRPVLEQLAERLNRGP